MGTDLADLVMATWREQLGIEVDSATEFFSGGGDSLMAMRIIAKLSTAYDAKVPLRLLFDNPECGEFIDALAEFLDTARRRG